MSMLRAVAAAGVLVAAQPLSAQEISNPDLFAKSLEAAAQAAELYGSYDNPAELRRIAEIGYRVAQESGYDDFPFSFFLVDIPVPNAFALPGGHVFLTRGMLDLGPDDDMLAGLLGHEIAHVVKQHGMKMQRRAALLNALSQALVAGVMIATSDSDSGGVPEAYDPFGRGGSSRGDRVMGAAAAGVVVSELLLRSYSREFEDESDDEGQRWAAAAGYDPNGYARLMQLMRERLPESQQFGYWRTHPFFDSRVRAAGVRQDLLKVQTAKPADDYRRRTQQALLDFEPRRRNAQTATGERREFLETAALTAWPRGEEADRIRLSRLHAARESELAKTPLEQDFGKLIATYRTTTGEVETVDPESPLLATLGREVAELDKKRLERYPEAREVFAGGVFQTGFLETFLSNFPRAEERAAVALALGDAYSRLRRPEEAVQMYLEAAASGRDRAAEPSAELSSHTRRAIAGLRNLAPLLDDLAALQQLASEADDPEVRRLAGDRLDESVTTYGELANGAAYLKEYPDGDLAPAVTERLNTLADALYGEAILYQRVGDHGKALERIRDILTQAPYSPAADKLRQGATVAS